MGHVVKWVTLLLPGPCMAKDKMSCMAQLAWPKQKKSEQKFFQVGNSSRFLHESTPWIPSSERQFIWCQTLFYQFSLLQLPFACYSVLKSNSLSMLLLRYEMNTWAARNSSWSENIIFSEVKCGPWNAKVGWQVAYRDRKTQFEVEICNLPANLSIPRATRDFRNNDVSRSWTVLSSPCIHWG